MKFLTNLFRKKSKNAAARPSTVSVQLTALRAALPSSPNYPTEHPIIEYFLEFENKENVLGVKSKPCIVGKYLTGIDYSDKRGMFLPPFALLKAKTVITHERGKPMVWLKHPDKVQGTPVTEEEQQDRLFQLLAPQWNPNDK